MTRRAATPATPTGSPQASAPHSQSASPSPASASSPSHSASGSTAHAHSPATAPTPAPVMGPGVGGGPEEDRLSRVGAHPDGWYWIAPDGHQQFGPFDSMEAVLADMEPGDASPDAGQTLQETERVLGLGDWIDPETGSLAEDLRTRIEDH